MSGKPGQVGKKPMEVATRFTADFLADVDGRATESKVLRQRYRELTNDLGGEANLSYQERSLSKRAIHVERLNERKELLLVAGGTCDENQYIAGIYALSGLFTKLGLSRRTKPVPNLLAYTQQAKETT